MSPEKVVDELQKPSKDKDPKISISVVLMVTSVSNDCILLTQHKDGRWSPPAGHVETTSTNPLVSIEKIAEAARREFEEETGYPKEILGKISPHTIVGFIQHSREDKHSFGIILHTVAVGKNLSINVARDERPEPEPINNGSEKVARKWFRVEEVMELLRNEDQIYKKEFNIDILKQFLRDHIETKYAYDSENFREQIKLAWGVEGSLFED